MSDAKDEPKPRERAEPLTEQAYRELEERIVTLSLEPGTLLSEQHLVDQTGLGRTPIREALQRLAGEGLVIIMPRRGIRVAEADPRKQLLVLEVRRELERLLCRLAAARATREQRSDFSRIAAGMQRAAETADDLTFLRLDRELNTLLIEAAQNEYAMRSMRLLQGHSRRFWYMHYREAADLPLCARLHAEQARAIAEGDADRAAASSDRLIDYTETFTRTAAGSAGRQRRP